MTTTPATAADQASAETPTTATETGAGDATEAGAGRVAETAAEHRSTTAAPYGPDAGRYPLPSAPDVRMRRSATDKMLLGVCGGIAEHTDIDPVYIRLAFLVSLFWGGIGILAYVTAAVVMPKPLR